MDGKEIRGTEAKGQGLIVEWGFSSLDSQYRVLIYPGIHTKRLFVNITGCLPIHVVRQGARLGEWVEGAQKVAGHGVERKRDSPGKRGKDG